MQFSENSQNSLSEKSSFSHFEIIFLNVKVFPETWFFPVSTFKEEYLNEKMSSLASLKKKLFNFLQNY